MRQSFHEISDLGVAQGVVKVMTLDGNTIGYWVIYPIENGRINRRDITCYFRKVLLKPSPRNIYILGAQTHGIRQ
jgi:hypothetical protein